jgi:hypothetical protein
MTTMTTALRLPQAEIKDEQAPALAQIRQQSLVSGTER